MKKGRYIKHEFKGKTGDILFIKSFNYNIGEMMGEYLHWIDHKLNTPIKILKIIKDNYIDYPFGDNYPIEYENYSLYVEYDDGHIDYLPSLCIEDYVLNKNKQKGSEI